MTSAREPGAGAAVTGLFLGSLAIAGAVALVTAPITPRMAVAQTVASPNDQTTAATLPGSVGTVKGRERTANGPSSSTASVLSGGRVDPLDHLSPRYRRDAERD